jgi:threonine/homoserine/homoserine lactone efflux protein
MNLFLEGALLGLSLSFLIGPLLFAIVQASLERGFRAGLAVAAGIWIGDVLYMLAVQSVVDALAGWIERPEFRLGMGLAGGTLLIAFGLGSLLGRQRSPEEQVVEGASRQYWAYALRGFLINLINPFTVFFWLGITSALVVPGRWDGRETALFFGGMLATLVVTDTLKAWGAKSLRRFLTPAHQRLVRRGIGFVLVGFGLVMVGRLF